MGSLLRRDVIQAIQFFGRWIIHNPSHAARTAKIPVFGTGYLPLSSSFSFSWENWAVVVVEICFRLIRYCTCIFVGKSKRKKHPVAIHHNHMAWDCACCRSCFHTGIVGHDEVLSGLLQSAMCLPSLLNLAIAFCRILEHASRSPFEFPLHCGRASAHY